MKNVKYISKKTLIKAQNQLIQDQTKILISMNANINALYEEILRTKAYIHNKLDYPQR